MKIIRNAALISLGAVLLAAGPKNAAAPRFDSWIVIGPGGGGAMYFPTVSPHNPNDVLVRCDMTGAYVTHDGGGTWRMFNLRGVVGLFVWDPADAKTVYATALGGLWRSTDAARTWNLIMPDPASIARIDRVGDHAEERIVTKQGKEIFITALAVDPANSKTLYAGMAEGGAFTLQVSDDWGRTWRKAADMAGGVGRIWIDPKSPRADRTIYVAGRTSVSVRRGGKWQEGAGYPEAVRDISAGWAANGSLTVYAMGQKSVFVSEDGGSGWRKTGLPHGTAYSAIATALNRSETAYVSYRGLREGERRFAGVAKTTDRGATWTPVWKEADQIAPNIQEAWVGERFGPGWGENPTHLGVGPNNPEVCYGTDFGRTMRTVNGGETWKAVYSTKAGEGYTSTGLDVTTDYGVHFDPFDHKRVFISYTDIGLFRSEDGGASWMSSTVQGVPRRWVNTTYWVEFDPAVKGRMWAVMSGIHDLPRPKMWRRSGVSRYNGGVLVSDDGGRSWKVCENLPQTAATHILLDPASPAESRTLYVAGFGKGIFKSTDGGKTWALKNDGIEGKEPFAWRIVRDGNGVFYAIIARRSDDGSMGGPEDSGAVYRSTDGAEHWTKLRLPEGVNGPNGLAVDPRDAKRLYLAAWGRATTPADTYGGVFVSTDGGETWKASLDRDQHVYDVTIDPRNPNLIYACGFSSSAWRSEDRGRTWQRIRGATFKWGPRVVPDPDDPSRIYVTTFGGSVWYGPAKGDAKAVEDIVTPQAGYPAR